MHRLAQDGFAAGAEAYARGRPDYPAEAIDWLWARLKLGERSAVVDLGAGTGKLSVLLASRGARVTAIEPVDQMRAAISQDIDARPGTAEATGLAPECADAVVAAQAFHWFDGACALREIHRVLRPGGALGLIWNVRDESEPWVAALAAIIDRHEGRVPRFAGGAWRDAFADSPFGPLEEARFGYVHRTSPSGLVDRVLSISFIAALSDPERSVVRAQLEALLRTHPALVGRDEIDVPYRTHVYASCRLDARARMMPR